MMRFAPVFAASFFLSVHFGILLYVNSSLLGRFFGPSIVSLLFLLGSAGSILIFLFAPKLIRRFGKRPLLLLSLIFTAVSTFGLALTTSSLAIAVFFIVYASFLPVVYYCLDIFLEELSLDTRTGEIRGIYLTVLNLGIVLGPFTLAFLSTMGEELKSIYLIAGLLLVFLILSAFFSFKTKTKFPEEHKPFHHSPRLPFDDWWRNKDVRHITLARLALESFFAFMVIYVPIYLRLNLGFEWSELGVMFSIMLLPFVLFQWPMGELADRFYGEKEILTAGFIITALSLLIMPFLGKAFLAWIIILFLSRVGASFIEIMTESYFFKQIGPADTGFISIFRLARPASIALGATIGVLALNLFSFEKIFFVVVIVIFFGLQQSLSLKDTR